MGILDLFGFGSVANFAHLGGLISGIIFAMIYKIMSSKVLEWLKKSGAVTIVWLREPYNVYPKNYDDAIL